MTNGWEQPERPIAPAIEVPLTGDGPLAITTGTEGADQPPNWRKVVGLASLGGIVIGILTSIVLIGFVWDDDPLDGAIPSGPTSTIDEFDLATAITTPPTLPSLNRIPPRTTEPTGEPQNTTGTPAPALVPFPGAPETYGTLPSYAVFTGVPEGGLDGFDLTAAVASLGSDVARRSTTHVEYRLAINTLDITIVRDPFNNRYRLTFASADGERNFVVDIDSGTTYITTEQGEETAIPNSKLVGLEASQLPGYLDRLMLGPLRPDTLAFATVEPRTMVFLEGRGTIAREFAVELPGAIVPDWQFYDLDPASTPPAEDVPGTLSYLAYVDDQGELSRLIGTAMIRGEQQLVIHQIERLGTPDFVPLPTHP